MKRRIATILFVLAVMYAGIIVVHAKVPHACMRGPRGECSHGNKTQAVDVCDYTPWCSLMCFVGMMK